MFFYPDHIFCLLYVGHANSISVDDEFLRVVNLNAVSSMQLSMHRIPWPEFCSFSNTDSMYCCVSCVLPHMSTYLHCPLGFQGRLIWFPSPWDLFHWEWGSKREVGRVCGVNVAWVICTHTALPCLTSMLQIIVLHIGQKYKFKVQPALAVILIGLCWFHLRSAKTVVCNY